MASFPGAVENFRLISSIKEVWLRAMKVDDDTLVNPQNTDALLDGEILTIKAGYQVGRPVAGDFAAGPPVGQFLNSPVALPIFHLKGATDVQAAKNPTVIWHGHFEADTLIFNASPVTAYAPGTPVTVVLADLGDGVTRSVLDNQLDFATQAIVGTVTRLPADNNGYLRFEWRL